MSKPPGLSKLLILLGAISILTPFSLDMYLPALPAIARDLKSTAGAVELTLPSFFAGLALSQLLFGTLQFVFAGLAGAAVSALYDGPARAMAGVMCAAGAGAVILYRWTR